MRYPYRTVFVDGLAAGVLLNKGGRLVTTYTRTDYFIDMRRSELQAQGRLEDADPSWIDPSLHDAGLVTLGEVKLSDDMPEILDDASPESLASWRAFWRWVDETVVRP